MAEFGDHWVRKIKSILNRLDSNGNGALSHDDVTQIGERHIKVTKMNRSQAEETRAIYDQIWKVYFEPLADKEGCTPDSVIQNAKKAGKHNLMGSAYNIFNACFDTIDHKKSGFVTVDEYKIFFHILGLNEAHAKDAFDALDTNHDGVISRGEFITGGVDYVALESESLPGDLIYGKLD